jgi:hypothetical protein
MYEGKEKKENLRKGCGHLILRHETRLERKITFVSFSCEFGLFFFPFVLDFLSLSLSLSLSRN